MKIVIKAALTILLLVSTSQIKAFEAQSTTPQAISMPNMSQNILLDGNNQTYIAPIPGNYVISFTATAQNPSNTPARITVFATENTVPSAAIKTEVIVPGGQTNEIKFDKGSLELSTNDVVNFRFKADKTDITLQRFEVKINPSKPSVKL